MQAEADREVELHVLLLQETFLSCLAFLSLARLVLCLNSAIVSFDFA